MNHSMEIPQEINIRIASFLSVPDVIKYQNSCKYLKRTINLNILHKASPIEINDLHETGDYKTGHKIRPWTRITPLLFQSLTHTVKLTCVYKDQGWGNQKGNIYITEMQNSNDQEIGKIIATSPTAEHQETRCRLLFEPKPGCTYGLCYKAGGGGGHELFVRNVKLESFVHCASIPLANKILPTMPDLFFMDMIRSTLDTVTENDDGGQCGRLLSQFQSVGLDLRNEQYIEEVRLMLEEFRSMFCGNRVQ